MPKDVGNTKCLQIVKCVMNNVWSARKDEIAPGEFVSFFHVCDTPAVPVGDFLENVYSHCRMSDQSLVSALVVLNRLLVQNPKLTLSSRTVHKLLLCCCLVSAKVVDDKCCTNVAYANAGGIELKELNMLERETLHLLDHSLYVSPEEHELQWDHLRRASLHSALTCTCSVAKPAAHASMLANVLASPALEVSSKVEVDTTTPSCSPHGVRPFVWREPPKRSLQALFQYADLFQAQHPPTLVLDGGVHKIPQQERPRKRYVSDLDAPESWRAAKLLRAV